LRLRQFQPGSEAERAIGVRSRTGLVSMSPKESSECGDVVARTRKPGAAALRGASTEHAE
jgi:hypothetical protein